MLYKNAQNNLLSPSVSSTSLYIVVSAIKEMSVSNICVFVINPLSLVCSSHCLPKQIDRAPQLPPFYLVFRSAVTAILLRRVS